MLLHAGAQCRGAEEVQDSGCLTSTVMCADKPGIRWSSDQLLLFCYVGHRYAQNE
jgi:hypothetical protein